MWVGGRERHIEREKERDRVRRAVLNKERTALRVAVMVRMDALAVSSEMCGLCVVGISRGSGLIICLCPLINYIAFLYELAFKSL